MKNRHLFIFEIILFVEIVTGTLGNGFIAVVNIIDWVKGRKISAADQMLTALALCRLSLVWSVLVCTLLFILSPHLFMSSEMLTVMSIIWIMNNHFSIWLATSLSVFYFLKIANFSNSFFLYLKLRVKKVILMMLMGSLIFLILNIAIVEMCSHSWFDVFEGNMSYSLSDSPQFLRVLLFTNSSKIFLVANSSHAFLPINSMFMSIPFSVSLVAFLLLIFSLWKHHKRMQTIAKRPGDISTMVHVKAMQTGFFILLLYMIYLLFIVIGILSLGFMGEIVTILFDYFSALAFPISHSFVLILGNSKLRQATLCCSV